MCDNEKRRFLRSFYSFLCFKALKKVLDSFKKIRRKHNVSKKFSPLRGEDPHHHHHPRPLAYVILERPLICRSKDVKLLSDRL